MSSFSSSAQRDKSKCIIALPTSTDHIERFEKTLIGGFSCVRTRLAFDLQIVLPNDKKDKLKVIYDLKIEGKRQKNQIVCKILKMDENNQYGNAMTKPLPYSCIKKEKEIPDLKKFNLILQTLSPDDKIGHLFVVDIMFNEKNVDKKTLLFKEIYMPVFEKNTMIKPFERPVLQLQSVMVKNDKGALKTFKCNKKTHSTMKKKFFCRFRQSIYIS